MLHGHEWCVDQRKDKERWRGAEHSREEVCWLLVGSRPRPRLSAPSSTSTLLPQYFSSTDEQSGALANLSPNDQRHITTPTRSSSPPRFGKCQTGSPSVLPASHSKPWTQIDFYFWLPHFNYVTRAQLLLLMSWVALSFKLCEWVWDWWYPTKSFCRSLIKVNFYWSCQTCSRVSWLFVCLFGRDHAKKGWYIINQCDL